MGRHSCCTKQKLRKGLWSPEEDEKLFNYISRFGVGCWSSVPKLAGLQRCGKSCRLRWINYLRPDLKRGMFSQQEEDLIINLHKVLGNRWAQIAAQLPGRTDNEIKNFWNSSLKKKLMKQGIDPTTHHPLRDRSEVSQGHKNDVVSSTHNPGQPINGVPPPPIMAVKSEPPLFMDTSTLANNEQGQHHYGAGQFLIKPPPTTLEGSSSDFELDLGPIGFNWAHIIASQDHFQSQPLDQMSQVFGFGLQCPEAEPSNPSVLPRVDSFSMYNGSNEAKESSSSYSSISTSAFSGWDGIPGNYAKLEGLFCDYNDDEDEDHNNKINGGGVVDEFEDRKPAYPWLMERIGLDEHHQLSSYPPLKLITEELGSSKFEIYQQL